MLLAVFFVLAAAAGFLGLVLVGLRTVPPISGTCAFILTLAALGVAVLR
ncbi:membrane protein [Streptomyces phage OnionKnight]|nr:membrane protein [Streptomyces phage OnionKnight]